MVNGIIYIREFSSVLETSFLGKHLKVNTFGTNLEAGTASIHFFICMPKAVRATIRFTMLKFTKHTLKKLESLFGEIEYTIRYERGNFQSGYCMVENQNVIVINKYFDTEGRINTLLDILVIVQIDPATLTETGLKTWKLVQKHGQIDLSTLSEEE